MSRASSRVSDSEPNPLTMPREEVRMRLLAVFKIFPYKRCIKILKYNGSDLLNFAHNRPHRYGEFVGPRRLKRIAKFCLDVERGIWEWNGKPRFQSRCWKNAEPKRAAKPLHRVMFQSGSPTILQGKIPETGQMPSFKSLFASKGIPLPFVGEKGK